MAIDIKEILANGLLDLCHKKDLSQVTVKDLLETTGVSRQTFYNHFLDKNDLIQYIYNHKIINHFNGQNTNLDFYESLIESFEHMKQYQTFLKQPIRQTQTIFNRMIVWFIPANRDTGCATIIGRTRNVPVIGIRTSRPPRLMIGDIPAQPIT